jgi:hypothetical protein
MAIKASIEINFSIFHQDNVIIQLIQMLLDSGWTLDNEGKVSYLSPGHNNISDWKTDTHLSYNALMEILAEKDGRKEPVGIILTWHNTNIGGSFIFQTTNEKLSIDLTLNRKIMSGLTNVEITDSNWYFTRLLPIFYENNIEVYNFSLSEINQS